MDHDAFRRWATYIGLPGEAIAALSRAAADHADEDLAAASRALLGGEEPPVADVQRSALAAVLAVPAAVDAHARRGIPDPVTRATLADIALWIAEHHRRSGTWGLKETGWIRFHLAGRLLRLGRLQFKPATYRGQADPEGLLREDDPILEIHIPAGGPLLPEDCDASLAEAARVYADLPWRGFTCASWLLGTGLADVLPGDANILRFQRRFRQLPSDMDDRQTIERVFGAWPLDRRHAPAASALQRAVLAYYDRGGRLPGGAGFIPR